MKRQIFTLLIIYVIILTGCSNAKQIEEQQIVTEELIEADEPKDEYVFEEEIGLVKDDTEEREETVIEESVISSERIEEEVIEEEKSVFRTIPTDEVVYEENDVVFIIAKRSQECGACDYGYLISVGGKVVPFQVLHDDFFTWEMGADYGNILDMEIAEPIMELEDDIINYYIEKLKAIDNCNEMENTFNGYDYEFEHVFLYGREVDYDKYVEEVDIYKFTSYISEPTDPNAIELMNWLLELNETLTEETKEEY